MMSNVAKYHRVLLGISRYRQVALGIAGYYQVLPETIKCCQVSSGMIGITRHHQVSPGISPLSRTDDLLVRFLKALRLWPQSFRLRIPPSPSCPALTPSRPHALTGRAGHRVVPWVTGREGQPNWSRVGVTDRSELHLWRQGSRFFLPGILSLFSSFFLDREFV